MCADSCSCSRIFDLNLVDLVQHNFRKEKAKLKFHIGFSEMYSFAIRKLLTDIQYAGVLEKISERRVDFRAWSLI